MWNLETGKEIRTFNHSNPVKKVAISPNGELLASGTEDGNIMIWELQTGKLKTPLAAHLQAISSLAFNPDGKTLASSSHDKTIKLWNMQTGHLLNILTGHNGAVWSVAFSPNGKILASGSYDQKIKLWDVQNWQLLDSLAGHHKAVWSVAFNPKNNTFASGSSDETVKIWQLSKNINTQLLPSVPELAAVLTRQPEITNYPQLYDLNQQIYNKINSTWLQRNRLEKDLIYRVGVATNGTIVGYKFITPDVSTDLRSDPPIEQATLNDLLYKLVARRIETNEPLVHFKVVFTKEGVLEVSSWYGYSRFY